MNRWSSVPRDFSTQIDPAITAGAASITRINWSSASQRKNCSLIEAASAMVRSCPSNGPQTADRQSSSMAT